MNLWLSVSCQSCRSPILVGPSVAHLVSDDISVAFSLWSEHVLGRCRLCQSQMAELDELRHKLAQKNSSTPSRLSPEVLDLIAQDAAIHAAEQKARKTPWRRRALDEAKEFETFRTRVEADIVALSHGRDKISQAREAKLQEGRAMKSLRHRHHRQVAPQGSVQDSSLSVCRVVCRALGLLLRSDVFLSFLRSGELAFDLSIRACFVSRIGERRFVVLRSDLKAPANLAPHVSKAFPPCRTERSVGNVDCTGSSPVGEGGRT